MAISITEKIKTIGKLIFEPKVLSSLLSMRHSGYLIDTGWIQSLKNKRPFDNNLNPIPWLTYPFIRFMDERLNSSLHILEFGAGNSTFYFSVRTAQVTSIEHDLKWYKELKHKVPSNVNLIFQEIMNEEEYLSVLKADTNKYQVILIDAEKRNECLLNCLSALSKDGIVILDDSEREEYSEGITHIIKAGFKKLDFWGISPGYTYLKCTTIFYKENNCFGL